MYYYFTIDELCEKTSIYKKNQFRKEKLISN